MNQIKKIIGSKAQYLGVKKLSKNWKPLKQHEKFQTPNLSAVVPVQYWEANNALRFVDTISVRFLYTIPDPVSVGLLLNIRTKIWYENRTYENEFKALNGASIYARYKKASRTQPKAGITLKFSVPKLLQGNNFQLVPAGTDVIAIIDTALRPIFDQLKMPALSFAQGEIRELHISYNFQVGKNVYRYLSYIGECRYSRRDRYAYNNRRNRLAGEDKGNNGNCFFANAIQTGFYAKGEECGNPLADELLRMETQYKNPSAVWKLFRREDARFKSQRPRVIDLTTNLCQRVLYGELTRLGLNIEIVQTKYMWDILREKGFSACMTNRLLGFIYLERDHHGLSTKDLHAVSGLSEPTIREFRRKLRKAGVSYILDEDMTQPITLPPLTLDAFDDFSPQTDGIADCGEINSENEKIRTSVPHDICLDPRPMPGSEAFMGDEENANYVLVEEEENCPMPEPPPWDLSFLCCPEADMDEHETSSADSFAYEHQHAMDSRCSWDLAVGDGRQDADGAGNSSFHLEPKPSINEYQALWNGDDLIPFQSVDSLDQKPVISPTDYLEDMRKAICGPEDPSIGKDCSKSIPTTFDDDCSQDPGVTRDPIRFR